MLFLPGDWYGKLGTEIPFPGQLFGTVPDREANNS